MSEIFKKVCAMKIEPTYTCESLCAFKDKVLIGTKGGQIIVYSINFEKPDDKSSEIKSKYCFIIRDPNRKSITQIELAEEFGIFISLSMGAVYIHRINDYKLIHICELKTISRFCLDSYLPSDLEQLSRKKRSDSQMVEQNSNETNLKLSIVNEEIRSFSELRMCVVVKMKLHILNWDKDTNTFKMSGKVIKLPDYPVVVQFLSNFLCVGTKSLYILVKIENGDVSDLIIVSQYCLGRDGVLLLHKHFGKEKEHTRNLRSKNLCTVGKCQDPYIMRVSDMLGLKVDDTVEFVDKEGNLLGNGNLRWSFVPSVLTYHPPFAISLLNKFIEVRMISPTMLIQSLPIDNGSSICRYMDRLYILSDKKLIMLLGSPRNQQVQNYVNSKDFEVALILAKTAPLVGEPPIESTKISILYALSLFENRQFKQSFQIFFEMTTDPSHVLNLFPSLCPEKFKNLINLSQYTNTAQGFSEGEREEAIRALIDYLVKWRGTWRKFKDSLTCTSIIDGRTYEKSKSSLQQIVDTTLLKCYLRISPSMIAPLLRRENYCHFDETKNTLEKNGKFEELIILYESKGVHDKALSLLHSQSVKTHSSLKGINPTIKYMKKLNSVNLDLIYQYGDWILDRYPMDWLTIFIYWFAQERMSSKEKIPEMVPAYKESVLKHLQQKCPDMVIPFLERFIYKNDNNEDLDLDSDKDCNESELDQCDSDFSDIHSKNLLKYKLLPINVDDLPIIEDSSLEDVRVMHTSYIKSLVKKILSLRNSLLLQLNIEKELENSSPDSNYVYDLRIRLKKFLQSEKACYNADAILSTLPYDAFYEERSLMLARTGKHEQALTLWIYVIDDFQRAEDHCMKVYETNKDIFYKYLSVCIEPSDPASIGIVLPTYDFTSIIDGRKTILNNKLVPQLSKALEIMNKHGDKLNPSLAIRLLSSAFEIKDLLPFTQNSLRKQASQLNQFVSVVAKKSFTVDENSKCSYCKKFMASTAFVRKTDQSLVHYGCAKDISDRKI